MFLKDVEAATSPQIEGMKGAGVPVPGILHNIAFKPAATDHLARFSEAVMRGPSPLPAGLRELVAAFTSRRNDCLF